MFLQTFLRCSSVETLWKQKWLLEKQKNSQLNEKLFSYRQSYLPSKTMFPWLGKRESIEEASRIANVSATMFPHLPKASGLTHLVRLFQAMVSFDVFD